MQEQTQNPKEGYLAAGERITLAEARNRIALFKRKYMEQPPAEPEFIKANFFSKKPVLEVLHQPGCEGLRIYHSVNPAGQDPKTGQVGEVRELILIGTDKKGNDLLTTADYPPPGKGCNFLSAIIALPASPQQVQDAVLMANPIPCPNMCGDKGDLGDGN